MRLRTLILVYCTHNVVVVAAIAIFVVVVVVKMIVIEGSLMQNNVI